MSRSSGKIFWLALLCAAVLQFVTTYKWVRPEVETSSPALINRTAAVAIMTDHFVSLRFGHVCG